MKYKSSLSQNGKLFVSDSLIFRVWEERFVIATGAHSREECEERDRGSAMIEMSRRATTSRDVVVASPSGAMNHLITGKLMISTLNGGQFTRLVARRYNAIASATASGKVAGIRSMLAREQIKREKE